MKKHVIVLGFMFFLPSVVNAWTDCGIDANGRQANCEYQIIDGTLTIRGTGDNGNIGNWIKYDDNGGYELNAPWRAYSQEVNKIVLADNIKDVGSYGFAGMHSDVPVNIPSGVVTIGYNAFYTIDAPEVVIPNTVTTIESSAFNWSSIQKIDIPDSVTTMDACLRGTGLLKELIIPDSVKYVSEETLTYTGLETLVISDKTTLGKMFNDYNNGELRVDLSKIKIYCMGDTATCDANLQAAGYENLKTVKANSKKINGMTYVFDTKGNLIGTSGKRAEKRIYSVEEASMVAGKKNKVMIRYK